jgi:hypothetical protein
MYKSNILFILSRSLNLISITTLGGIRNKTKKNLKQGSTNISAKSILTQSSFRI